ncbi:glycosyltransferase [Mesorhizobium sp.]|uniref:glycosyltransferase n=1 Tax=Mesorhizobium sp. TaxID=1871066 RepID=UPI000FE9BF96|nr:glycosyltransferase [Mesorhizobium sp.]RWE73778.1 MAG: glycosyltransferase [Mesorhizobium sp.]TIV31578.1 MAG: glycosyltransferase [Mesorhizobium sp.]
MNKPASLSKISDHETGAKSTNVDGRSLHRLYDTHKGKVSDKWSIYLDEYERIFSTYRSLPVRILEIGIQNGGSLEIWAKYFPQAKVILGCDIDQKCGLLSFRNKKISVVVGDAGSESVRKKILERSDEFDIVIDDGSHRSSDVVRAFARYFPHLSDGGVFVAEDLHTSYWKEFEGGLYDPMSSMSFFKRLLDLVNHEHWGLDRSRTDALAAFADRYGVSFDESSLASIHSIEFLNSLCVVTKRPHQDNVLGSRHIVGREALVEQSILDLDDATIAAANQAGNPWSLRSVTIEQETFENRARESVQQAAARLGALADEIVEARERIASVEAELARVRAEATGKAREVEALQAQLLAVEAAKNSLAADRDSARSEERRLQDQVRTLSQDRDSARAEERRAHDVLQAVFGSTSWRITRPVRLLKKKATEFRSVATGVLRLIRERRLTSATIARGVRQLPRLIREGKLSNPTSFSDLAETLDPESISRIQTAFDREFYLRSNPDIASTGVDALSHFLAHGWKEHRDPSADFSVSYYLKRYPDIARAGLNPFIHYVLHGQGEKRTALSYKRRLERSDIHPKVTAIVPNYNHERFLERRIESILSQTYKNIEIVILDDCSTDNSHKIIQRYCDLYPGHVRSHFNTENSGNVFRQWRKGIEQSEGDLIWICESDDFCEPDFVEHLIPHLRDRSVNLAFGRIQFCDQMGRPQPGLDQYREGAEAGIWNEPMVRPASEWFARGFGVNNVIANVGGCLWRRQVLSAPIWTEAESFSVLGDWFLYCHLAGGGNIAYEPAAVAYFRQHGQNTSVSAFKSARYYTEHHRLMTLLRKTWDVPEGTVERFMSKVEFQYKHFELEQKLGPLSLHVDKRALLEVKRERMHIMLAFLGFHTGGGELFPINLANELHSQGHIVSMLALDMSHINQDMLRLLDPAIPVYDADQVVDLGGDTFIAEAGVSVIHSHMALLEVFFFEYMKLTAKIPYVVSLHGSYESADLSADLLRRIGEGVTHWVYTTDRNLEPLRVLSISEAKLTKLGNGMPHDATPFPQTRQELGIKDDAVVFTLVARGILRKGWRAAISAFIRLRDRHPERPLYLLLCGDGEQAAKHERTFGSERGIIFLGYQSRIPGLYRISDVALVPTRFEGESFPLCIIQAMQAGTPIISTRVGEIENMVAPDGHPPCGLVIDPVRDTDRFIQLLETAMEDMLSDTLRRKYAKSAVELGARYSISKVAEDYVHLYDKVINSNLISDNSEEGRPLEWGNIR